MKKETVIRYGNTGIPCARLKVDRPLAIRTARAMVRYGRKAVIIDFPRDDDMRIVTVEEADDAVR